MLLLLAVFNICTIDTVDINLWTLVWQMVFPCVFLDYWLGDRQVIRPVNSSGLVCWCDNLAGALHVL